MRGRPTRVGRPTINRTPCKISYKCFRSKDIFSDRDLRGISDRTDRNYHTENLLFISKKMKSKTQKGLAEVQQAQEKLGYLDSKNSKKRFELSKTLRTEMTENLSQRDYKQVKARM